MSLMELVIQPAFLSSDGKYQTSSMTSEVISINPFTGYIVDDGESSFARSQTIYIIVSGHIPFNMNEMSILLILGRK